MTQYTDTIAALATPPGSGGIGILRISGPEAQAVMRRLFRPKKVMAEAPFEPRHMYFGHALDEHGEVFDEVLAVFMPGPSSSTGEDVAEIHCHGGPGVTATLLEAALAAGARLAEAGEFTRRAFFNGRMDLTQAEAVAELIAAPGREGVRLAAAKLEGALGRAVREIRDSLDAMRIQVALSVDFPEEDAELLSHGSFVEMIGTGIASIDRLLAGFDRAKLWRDGASAVLVGRVNAGKSSLLNLLLGRERAIVSSAPGTTRDYIEESVNIEGIPLRVIDTAGLRESEDTVEEEGIRRSVRLADEADIVLFVSDIDADIETDELDFLYRNQDRIRAGRLLLVLNKVDALAEDGDVAARAKKEALGRGRAVLAAAGALQAGNGSAALVPETVCFPLSAKTGAGLGDFTAALRKALLSLGSGGAVSAGEIAPNLRQAALLKSAKKDLEELLAAVHAGHPADILGVHLECAARALVEVTGMTGTEELLDSIFSSFCIGK